MDPKSSFGINETLRIVVPGYYFLAMVCLYARAANLQALQNLSSDVSFFLFIMVGLAIGFVFFTFNYPNRRDAYREGLPSDHLWKFSHEQAAKLQSPKIALDKSQNEHVQLYLYILNNFFPQTFHDVIIIRGGLYFCITYVWLISVICFFLGFASFVALGVLKCLGQSFLGFPIDRERFYALALYSALQFTLFALLFFPKRADRTLRVLYFDQIEWMKLNEPLIRHLLTERLDPTVFKYFPPNKEGKT